ncbi:universal stress protein [Oryzifoliimicrobium ureilyticus]|uniref:universal stress protein n=1 Tax=Oryzifoliimicrobium ureilyticus TaxID=3113724 RepID=UPI003075F4BC
MAFKTVLATIGATHAQQDIDRAIAIAIELDAHLSFLVLGSAVPPFNADYPFTAVWIDDRQEKTAALLSVQEKAAQACRTNGISFDISHRCEDRFVIEHDIALRAMYVDVVLMGIGVRKDIDLREAVISAAVFDTRTPLIILPEGSNANLRPKNVCVAWNSRVEAVSAVRASMDLLKDADEVHLTLVDPNFAHYGNGGEPGADIAAFLSRHGVDVVIEQVASGGRPTEDVLRQHVTEIGCDMIVMGSYGHSRLRERIFGGVTAAILEDCPVPVLMAR